MELRSEQSLDNPAWIEFLLFGNDGFSFSEDGRLVPPSGDALVVRRALRAFVQRCRSERELEELLERQQQHEADRASRLSVAA